MTKYILIICVACFTVCFYSCGDDEDLVTDISVSYDFRIDNEPISLGESYLLNGSTVMFETANYYIHNLRMTADGLGQIIYAPGQHLLAGVGSTSELEDQGGGVLAGRILSTELIIGVNEDVNNQTETDFTERSSNDPLGLQDPSMHWNWNSGYKFVRFDGEVDTDSDGIVDTPIAYHIGSDALLTRLNIDSQFQLQDGSNQILISMDLNEFFKGVDFQLEENWDTHTGNNLELAQLLVSNMESTFSLSN